MIKLLAYLAKYILFYYNGIICFIDILKVWKKY